MTASDRVNTLGTYHVDEESYRKEWATLTGRSESEIYVPKGIRDDRDADPLPASEASGA